MTGKTTMEPGKVYTIVIPKFIMLPADSSMVGYIDQQDLREL
jgi:hypothetical protein